MKPRQNAEAETDDEPIYERLETRLQPLELLGEHIEYRVRQTTQLQRISAVSVLAILLIAVTPVAAQGEFCDSAFGTLLGDFEGMSIALGTTFLGIMLFVGVIFAVITPMFPGQSALGIALLFLSLAAGVAMVFGISFLEIIFEAAGVDGESCSTIVE